MVKPKMIICDEEIIGNVMESIKNVQLDTIVYAFTESETSVKPVSDLLNGYDTEPASFM